MEAYPVNISFNQVLELVKKLPVQKKRILSKEIEKDFVDKKLTELLSAFKTDEISQDEIDKTVESVRSRIHASKTAKGRH